MLDEELIWLFETAALMKSVVEIGSWMGRSTFALCTGCPGPVWAVDHFLGSEEHQGEMTAMKWDLEAILKRNVGHFPNIRITRATSEAAASLLPPVDMVFIDGSHEYEDVSKDIALWRPKAKKLICGHDRGQDGVPRAIEEHFGNRLQSGPGCLWFVEVECAP